MAPLSHAACRWVLLLSITSACGHAERPPASTTGPSIQQDDAGLQSRKPDRIDTDHDGIPDLRDTCPNEKETYNGFEDDDGCPDKLPDGGGEKTIEIPAILEFRTSNAAIPPESSKVLDEMATMLIKNPEVELVELAGHADERSRAGDNLHLSNDRASAVLAALVQRGVPRDKVRAKGYGPYCPVKDDACGQGGNRCVEFRIAKVKDDGPLTPLGCPNAVAHGVSPDPVK